MLFCLVWTAGLAAQAHAPLHHEIERLDVELERAPESTELLVRRGRLHRENGDAVASLRDLDRALALDPAQANAMLERGLTLSALGRDGDAEAQLTRLLEQAPKSPLALAERARIRARSGRTDAALVDFDASLALHPDVELYLERGELLERAARVDEAAAGYRDGLDSLGDAVLLRLALIRVETARGNHAQALALVDEPLARAQIKTDWLLRRADVLAARGDVGGARAARQAALAEARRVVQRRPTALSLLARARAQRALGHIAEARADAELALHKSPRFRDAQILLDELAPPIGDGESRSDR